MHKKGLDWAQHLRGDLVVRIENLEAILADIEPLRLELERLKSQLKGVERLVAIYYEQLGYPKPAAAESTVLAQGEEAPGSIVAQPEKLGQDGRWTLVAQTQPAAEDDIGKEVRQALALLKRAAIRCFLASRLWLLKLRLRRSAPS